MNFIYERITYIFDPLHHFWEHEKIHKKISFALVIFFLIALFVIELERLGVLPDQWSRFVPSNHFYSVQYAFTVVLILEVISLIFTLPCSFSRSVGKQFEILALILMRNAFKELAEFPEPIVFIGNEPAVLRILSDGFGALLIFALLGLYYYMQSQSKTGDDGVYKNDIFMFVAAKKGIALILLGFFVVMGVNSAFLTFTGQEHTDFLYDFYTVLILADILVVLISQCYHPSFFWIFRNSGYALSTLLIRLALAAPPYYNVLMGVAAAAFAILLTMICGRPFLLNLAKRH